MKANIERGCDFLGCSKYCLQKIKHAEIVGGNLSGVTALDIAEELQSIADQRPDIAKPVWHCSLSAAPGERYPDERWNEIAQDLMKGLGFNLDKTAYLILRHNDKPHDHVHIEASRVQLDGTVYLGRNEHLRSTKLTQQLEIKYGLVRTKGPHYDPETGKIVMPVKKKLSKGEQEWSGRTKKVPPRQRLQEIITAAIKDRPTQAEYEQRLNLVGVTFKRSSNGYSYQLDGIPFKGSQLGTAYKWAQLQKSFTTPEQAEQQATYETRNAVWEAERKRRNKYQAHRSLRYSICQLSYSILPRPMGQAVQIAAELLGVVSKINDWREANKYRNQVEKLTARMNQIKTDRLASEKTRAVKPVVPATPAQREALPPEKGINPHFQQPLFEPVAPPVPALTATEIKLLSQANWEMLRYGENRRVGELQAITHPGLDIDVHRKPCPILVNGVPITEIENQVKLNPTRRITHNPQNRL